MEGVASRCGRPKNDARSTRGRRNTVRRTLQAASALRGSLVLVNTALPPRTLQKGKIDGHARERWAKSVRKHIKGYVETWHGGWVSIHVLGKKISAGVLMAITKEMAVGGRTKEVMRFVGAQDFLISHAHGHVKAPTIRSQSSSRCSARFSAPCQSA